MHLAVSTILSTSIEERTWFYLTEVCSVFHHFLSALGR